MHLDLLMFIFKVEHETKENKHCGEDKPQGLSWIFCNIYYINAMHKTSLYLVSVCWTADVSKGRDEETFCAVCKINTYFRSKCILKGE